MERTDALELASRFGNVRVATDDIDDVTGCFDLFCEFHHLARHVVTCRIVTPGVSGTPLPHCESGDGSRGFRDRLRFLRGIAPTGSVVCWTGRLVVGVRTSREPVFSLGARYSSEGEDFSIQEAWCTHP